VLEPIPKEEGANAQEDEQSGETGDTSEKNVTDDNKPEPKPKY
jgi:hypothetical protein